MDSTLKDSPSLSHGKQFVAYAFSKGNGPFRALNMDLSRRQSIECMTAPGQRTKAALPIRAGNERTVCLACHALPEDARSGREVDGNACPCNQPAVDTGKKSPTTSGNDSRRVAQHAGKHAGLKMAEDLFTLLAEDGGNGLPVLTFDCVIKVKKTTTGAPGKHPANATLACPHHSDEDNV